MPKSFIRFLFRFNQKRNNEIFYEQKWCIQRAQAVETLRYICTCFFLVWGVGKRVFANTKNQKSSTIPTECANINNRTHNYIIITIYIYVKFVSNSFFLDFVHASQILQMTCKKNVNLIIILELNKTVTCIYSGSYTLLRWVFLTFKI